MENTAERIVKCLYKTKMDKRSAFWQVDLTAADQELQAFMTLKVVYLSRRSFLSGWLMPQQSSRN